MHVVIVKASEDCVTPPAANSSYLDHRDSTTVRVLIYITDINDNPPRFVKEIFTGGVTTDADFGTEFMQIKVNTRILRKGRLDLIKKNSVYWSFANLTLKNAQVLKAQYLFQF